MNKKTVKKASKKKKKKVVSKKKKLSTTKKVTKTVREEATPPAIKQPDCPKLPPEFRMAAPKLSWYRRFLNWF